MNSIIPLLQTDKILSSNLILDMNYQPNKIINNSNFVKSPEKLLINYNMNSEKSNQTPVPLQSQFTTTSKTDQISLIGNLTTIISFYLPLGIIEGNMNNSNDSMLDCHRCFKKIKIWATHINRMKKYELVQYICSLGKKYCKGRNEIDQYINQHNGL